MLTHKKDNSSDTQSDILSQCIGYGQILLLIRSVNIQPNELNRGIDFINIPVPSAYPRTREGMPSRMVLTVTEDTPADMLAGSMELQVQLPQEHHLETQRVTVLRSTPMMDLLVQIATAHKLTASSYTLQAIGERGMVLPHQPNTPIGALDALQVKLLPKQGTFVPRKAKQANQPFETTFRLQVHLPRNQLYVCRVSPKTNLGEILEEVCKEKEMDKNKYELRHPVNLETLDLSLSLQDYHLQEITVYAKQGRVLGSALSTQDIMALQRQEERRRQQAKQGVFGFVFKKSKESSLSTDSLGGRSASPARSDETGRSTSPLQPPARPQRRRRPAPKPPLQAQAEVINVKENSGDTSKDKVVISHSRNSSDSSGYHEASVLSDNPDSAGRLPETLPRRNKVPMELPRKLAQTSQSSKSLSNLASAPGTLSHGISCTSLTSAGLRKKRAAPPPPVTRPLSSAISTQGLERIIDSEESLTSDMDPSKPPSDIDIGITTIGSKLSSTIDFTKPDSLKMDMESKMGSDLEPRQRSGSMNVKLSSMDLKNNIPVEDTPVDAKVARKRVGEPVPLPMPRMTATMRPEVPKRNLAPPPLLSRILSSDFSNVDRLSNAPVQPSTGSSANDACSSVTENVGFSTISFTRSEEKLEVTSDCFTSEDEDFFTPGIEQSQASFDYNLVVLEEQNKVESLPYDRSNCKQDLSIDEDKENVETLSNQKTALPKSEQNSSMIKERALCAVISTIPKCNHLDSLTMDSTVTQNKEREVLKDSKKVRIPRTASKSNDFEINSLERQKRHLTSHAEDITFALNLNVASNVGLLSDKSVEFDRDFAQPSKEDNDCHGVVGEKFHLAEGTSDTSLSETDVLLQKVSDTLSNSLPVSSSNEMPVSPAETRPKLTNVSKETDQKNQNINESSEKFIQSTSTPNLIVNSQQDTSDYVSAADEDLSVAEWEYQLPAPPSAFRDSASPVFDSFEAITLSPESFRDSEVQEPIEISNCTDHKNTLEKVGKQENKEQVVKKEIKKEIPQKKTFKLQKSEFGLKKEVMSELENKIGTLPQTTKDVDSRRVSNNPSTLKIAPIDNTLSNFTITTYSRQKSLNIFEEVQGQSQNKSSDERFIKTFATLSRNRSNLDESEDKGSKDCSGGTLQGKKKVTAVEENVNNKKLEPKIQVETMHRWQSSNEKSNIQRSKSYMSVCDKPNLQKNKVQEEESVKNGRNLEMDNISMKKATSISNLNTTAPKNHEKFSQWRENILKRQEEPTKEKQLQSIQVLKSILPQLKNAQQAEENVPKESSDTVLPEETRSETTSNEHSTKSNAVSPREPQTAPSNKKIESESKKTAPEMNKKRYIYSGPPMINLGSWSERPSANVQIKKDTDYKFGAKQGNNKTIININDAKDEVDISNNTEASTKLQKSKFEALVATDRKEPNELAKKLITHTTASGFKKPVLNKINFLEAKTNSDKPVVTGVELKKSFLENKQVDSIVDTTPMNFKELTKAFGQDVCLRQKPKRTNAIQLENDSSKQNGYASPDQCLTNGYQEMSMSKRFTSIVGIQSQSQNNLTFRNGTNMKGGQPMPVVKNIKLRNAKIDGEQNHMTKEDSTKEVSKESTQPTRPPTMPVITGVTLKSSRPKSMPPQVNRRDILLESIRNFGGRENLKSVSILTLFGPHAAART
ncbi:Cordon-bleu protein-like 1 [Habropoda laboriosa]|uniref:Cordon-bleu protein-like 1 n=1 Tax=Habropoda laboriosa TaxID=597456 RepID=A0A0L7RAU8_9HYME|nr:Cordon-bleu protein-like 1 [Habropoda laboriosa]